MNQIQSPPKSRVLIVDDHPLVRAGLKSLIEEESDLDVCGEAEGYSQALSLLEKLDPDLMVVDISIKDGNGLELVQTAKSIKPELKMIVASVHDEALYAERVLHAGAVGYVNKEAATEKIVEAIRSVLRGKVYLSEEMTERLLLNAAQVSQSQERSPLEKLSNRELEVFEMIGNGLSTKEIAEKIHLSVKTIETYRDNLKKKLNLQSGNELLRYAIQWVNEKM
ncbi:MAG: response regulator transcription factor [Candidatus Omnitrophica bacterium]|nr:response regulator transcription factor [Candidatus Omnitrophota bacterium]MCA9425435.1 response regulator transcription factor [Candidatus Omnitrophota bacterium]MCA9429661.1 response regulator transcription factor [Candidatus Omnitrophota bacterium]MCA9435328.1 response regulator transcription factor [Candidatus Omnitrophota bacterium]MCA9444490.1 response regulator transcription factor [Candidatus Omnitrophota bacterium]